MIHRAARLGSAGADCADVDEYDSFCCHRLRLIIQPRRMLLAARFPDWPTDVVKNSSGRDDRRPRSRYRLTDFKRRMQRFGDWGRQRSVRDVMQPHGQAPLQLLPLPGRQPEDIYNVPSCQLHNLRAPCTIRAVNVYDALLSSAIVVLVVFFIFLYIYFTFCIFGSYSFLSAVLQFHGSQFNGLVPFW